MNWIHRLYNILVKESTFSDEMGGNVEQLPLELRQRGYCQKSANMNPSSQISIEVLTA